MKAWCSWQVSRHGSDGVTSVLFTPLQLKWWAIEWPNPRGGCPPTRWSRLNLSSQWAPPLKCPSATVNPCCRQRRHAEADLNLGPLRETGSEWFSSFFLSFNWKSPLYATFAKWKQFRSHSLICKNLACCCQTDQFNGIQTRHCHPFDNLL